jgi:hypothetical protein
MKADVPQLQDYARKRQIKLVAFDDITLGTGRRYLVKGLIPREGLTVIWGAPKSGKSFWTFDMVMHVALDWEYRVGVYIMGLSSIAPLRAKRAYGTDVRPFGAVAR